MNDKQPARRFVVTEIIEQSTTQKVILESEWIAPTAQFWTDEQGHRYWAYGGYAFRILN